MTDTEVHPTAIIAPGAELGAGVRVGPYCVIGPHAVIGDRCRLHSHVIIEGRTTLGENNEIFPFAALGHAPQHLKHKGDETRLEIGADNRIRESVTMHPGSSGGIGLTKVGSHGLFMVGSHVAHDCQVGDHVVFANNTALGGHCIIEDFVILGGLSAVHQFVRIGAHAFLGGMSGLEHDLIPYGLAVGDRARLQGLNLVGLKRRGFAREQIQTLRNAYRLLFAPEGTLMERLDEVETMFAGDDAVAKIVGFVRARSDRALCLPEASSG